MNNIVNNTIYIGYTNYNNIDNKIVFPNGFGNNTEYSIRSPDAYSDMFSWCSWLDPDSNKFVRTSIYNIPSNKKYIFPICLLACSNFKELFNPNVIILPDKVVDDIRNDMCYLLFDYTTEGWGYIKNSLVEYLIMGVCDKYNILPSSVYYVDGDLKQNYDVPYNHFGLCMWDKCNNPLSDITYSDIINDIISKKERKYKICCFNRRGKDFRSYIIYSLMSMYKNKDIVLTASSDFTLPHLQYDRFTYKDNVDKNMYEEFLKLIPLENDLTNVATINPTYINEDLSKDSYIHVINETWFSDDSLFMSEKTFKPIIAMQPFILVSTPGLLNELKNMGYYTFPELFDESYDDITDPIKRLDFIVKEIHKVYSYSKKDLSSIMFQILPKLIHNKEIYKLKYNHMNDIYEILIKNIYNKGMHSDTLYIGYTIGDSNSVNPKCLINIEGTFGDMFIGRESNHIVRCNISEIPKNSRYIFNILAAFVKDEDIIRNKNISIPYEVIKDIKNGRCNILFDLSAEGYDLPRGIQKLVIDPIHILSDKYNIPYSSIFFTNADYKQTYKETLPFKCFTYLKWESEDSPISDNEYCNIISSIINKKNRKYKISCLNRRAKDYRMYLAYTLSDIAQNDDMLYTMSMVEINLKYEEFLYKDLVSDSKWNEFTKTLPWVYDKPNPYIDCNPIVKEIHTNSYIHVVAESLFKEDSISFSEKMFKPIIMMQPFIVLGVSHSLTTLKNIGYETFPEIFDESYDIIEDRIERLNAISKEIRRIYLYSDKELKNIMIKVLPKLIHNRELHKNRYNNRSCILRNLLNKEIYNEL
jgi:hypothetical protein